MGQVGLVEIRVKYSPKRGATLKNTVSKEGPSKKKKKKKKNTWKTMERNYHQYSASNFVVLSCSFLIVFPILLWIHSLN